jgi:acyl-coenzyme A thioesterase PaaI-like protein
MPILELPHTPGCLVCGRDNPHGLHLSFFVDPKTAVVQTTFTSRAADIGFPEIIHGGIIATVLDEAMVWAATWAGKRFCLCGELSVRFRQPARVDQPMIVKAKVESHTPRLIKTTATLHAATGQLLATATGKYVPVPTDHNATLVKSLIDEPTTAKSAAILFGLGTSV